jgi:hypothetical protein
MLSLSQICLHKLEVSLTKEYFTASRMKYGDCAAPDNYRRCKSLKWERSKALEFGQKLCQLMPAPEQLVSGSNPIRKEGHPQLTTLLY